MTRMISNTEITSYNTCTKLHDFMYNLEVEPRVYPLHIRRGYSGHAALEAYYREMAEGSSVDLCKKALQDSIEKELKIVIKSADFEHSQMLAELQELLLRYVDYYHPEPFRIISVEQIYTAPMIGDIVFGIYLDLLVEYISGTLRGDLVIIDNKFVNNFRSNDSLLLDGQLPKYIKTVKANGHNINKAIFNQIRYRKMKNPQPNDLFRRTPLPTTQTAIKEIWREQTEVAVEINTSPAKPRRIMSPMICSNCFFLRPCQAELNGQPINRMLEVDFKPRKSPLKNWVTTNAN